MGYKIETIKGYVENPPELRFTATGKAIANFQISPDPDEIKERDFTHVIAWEEMADLCAQLLWTNDNVYLKGYFKDNNWVTKDGTQMSKREFTANEVWIITDGQPMPIRHFEELAGERQFKSLSGDGQYNENYE